jgi:hypothetical protein
MLMPPRLLEISFYFDPQEEYYFTSFKHKNFDINSTPALC